MDRQSVERLRFDRRLKTRNGWIDAEQEEAYLAALPDVSDKMTTCAEEEDAAEAAAAESTDASPGRPPQPPELEPQSPAPVAGDFSTSINRGAAGEPGDASGPADQGSAGTFRSDGGFGSDSGSN